MCFALLAWVMPASADSGPDWLAQYEVAPSCPAPVTFRAMVERRLLAGPDALDHTRVQVEISAPAAAGSFRGHVSVDAAGQRLSRELADTSCAALAHALSLIVALAVDEAGAAAQARAARPRDGVSAAAKDEWGPDPPDAKVIDSGAPVPLEQDTPFRLGPLVRSSLQSGLAPHPVLGVGGGVRLGWTGAGGWDPLLELAAMAFDSPRFTHSTDVEVQFDALMIGALLCPLDLASGAAWSLRPCLDLQGGRLTVASKGRAVARPEARTSPWLSSGVSLQGGIAPWGGPVHLSLAVGGFVSAYRSRFYFSPNTEVFEVPGLGWRSSAGLGVAF